MEAIMPEITLGETICAKLKVIYFKEIPWADVYKDVAKKFTELKAILRKFYTDKADLEILTEVATYGLQDVADVFSVGLPCK